MGKFAPTVEVQKNTQGQQQGTLDYQSITAAPAYKHLSFEEIRLQVRENSLLSQGL